MAAVLGPAGDVLARRDHWSGRDGYRLCHGGQDRRPARRWDGDGRSVRRPVLFRPDRVQQVHRLGRCSGAPAGSSKRRPHFCPPNIPNSYFGGFNTLAIVLWKCPTMWLADRALRSLENLSSFCRTLADVGDDRGFAQYDRMGIPAINTAVIQPGMPRGTPPTPPGAVVPSGSMLDEDNYNFGDPAGQPTRPAGRSPRLASDSCLWGEGSLIRRRHRRALSCRTPSRSTCALQGLP